MRQIEQIIQFVARIVFHKDYLAYEIVYADTDTSGPDPLFLELSLLLKKKEFCQAEDLLFERLDDTDKRYLALAIDFYSRMNAYSDEVLEQNRFSREEILEGLKEILARFHVVSFEDA